MITNLKKLFLLILFSLLTFSVFGGSHYWHYETKNVSKGWSLQALSVSPSVSGINYLFETNNLADGFTVYKYIQTSNGPSWSVYFYDEIFGGGWNIDPSNTNAVVNNGEAVWVYNPGNEIKQVFIGDVAQNPTTKILKGFNLISAKTLKTGGISSVHGLTPNDGDTIYKFIGSNWSIYTFDNLGTPQWLPTEPTIGPYEGFWYFNASANAFDWAQINNLPDAYGSLERRQLFSFKYYDPSFPSWYSSIMLFATKLNTESMIVFYYAGGYTIPTDPNAWFWFMSAGPALQPNDENYTAFWASRPITYTNGFIKVSTW